jgi:hypothetical protein
MTPFQEPSHHVRSHPSKSNHSELHNLVAPEFSVSTYEIIRRAVMSERGLGGTFEFWDNALREHFS